MERTASGFISGTSNAGTGPAPSANATMYASVPKSATPPLTAAGSALGPAAIVAAMSAIAAPMPANEPMRSVLRPSRSMTVMAASVPSTLNSPTAADAAASEGTPADRNTSELKYTMAFTPENCCSRKSAAPARSGPR